MVKRAHSLIHGQYPKCHVWGNFLASASASCFLLLVKFVSGAGGGNAKYAGCGGGRIQQHVGLGRWGSIFMKLQKELQRYMYISLSSVPLLKQNFDTRTPELNALPLYGLNLAQLLGASVNLG